MTNQKNIYISKQDCKLKTAPYKTLWTRQNITAWCVCCLCNVYHTVQCLKRNLRCSVSAHSSKNTRTHEILKIPKEYFLSASIMVKETAEKVQFYFEIDHEKRTGYVLNCLRKQRTFHDSPLVFQLNDICRNSTPFTCHYPELGSALW